MAALTVIAQFTKGDYWAFTTNDTMAGIETSMTVNGAQIPEITATGYDLLVDGMGLFYAKVAGGVLVRPMLQTYPAFHYLEDFTTVGDTDSKHWPSLGVPLCVQSSVAFVVLTMTTAVADVIRFSMWGRYIRRLDDPKLPPQTIMVDGFKWPLTKRLG